MLPVLPTGGSQQLALGPSSWELPPGLARAHSGMPASVVPTDPGECGALVDRLEELDLGAVEVGDDGTLGASNAATASCCGVR